MKNIILALLLATSSLAAQEPSALEKRIDEMLDKAGRARFAVTRKADLDYRAAVAATIQFVDRAEVYLVDFAMGKDPRYPIKDGDPVFPIHPYNRVETGIWKTAKVPAKQLAAWRAAAAKMVASTKEGGSAFCHFPIHGLRLYVGEKLLFETSLCWECRNYYFNYDGHYDWVSMTDDVADLKKLLHDLMPIPEEEKLRFKNK